MNKYSAWECNYCGTQNSSHQKTCGARTVNGCGARREDADTMNPLIGALYGELIYLNDSRLPDLLSNPAYCSIIRV